jgi:ribosomal protein S18 acetylase RimI-like enzyme
MDTRIKRIREFDKDLVALLFVKAGEDQNINPATGFFNDANNILLVAYKGGIPAGFLYAYILPGLKTPNPKMFLYSIDVFVDFQRQNIATELIGELKNIAFTTGCSEIFVLTNKSNKPAMNLYLKTGGIMENNDDVLFVYDREIYAQNSN